MNHILIKAREGLIYILDNFNITKFVLAATFYTLLTVASHNGIKFISSEDIGIAVFYAFYLLPWAVTFFVKGLALINQAPRKTK